MLNLYVHIPKIALLISIVARKNTDFILTGTISIEAECVAIPKVYLLVNLLDTQKLIGYISTEAVCLPNLQICDDGD